MRRKAWLGLATGLLLAGCVPVTPTFNTTYYENVEDMNRAGRAVGLTAVEPTKTPIGGRLKVVVPTLKAVAEKVVTAEEKEQIDKMEAATKEKTMAMAAGRYRTNYRYFGEIIRKSGLFSEVTFEDGDFDKEPEVGGFDHVHWFRPKEAEGGNFWFKGKDGAPRPFVYKPNFRPESDADFYKKLASSYAAAVEDFMRANHAPRK